MRQMAWRVGAQLFYVGVVLAVFAELQGRTEVLMVALFGLIYALVRNGQINAGLALANFARELQRELDWIKVKLIPDFNFDRNVQEKRIETMDRARYGLIIEAIGASAVSLICLFKIFSVLGLNT